MGNSNSRDQQPRPQVYDRPYQPGTQGPAGPAYHPNPYASNGRFYGHWPNYAPPAMGPPRGSGGPQQQRAQQQAQPDKELAQTSTIRNAVNLKKATLQLAPVDGEPHKLAVLFSFDASAPCLVTVFFMAHEDASNHSKVTTSKQPPTPGILYEQGLGLQFPKADGAAAIIDTSLYDSASLTPGLSSQGPFPLVVRLETITAKGLADGHTLQELVPGDEQKFWVQSQTTLAEIFVDAEGAFVPRVLKQKIWVDNISYELQEIYGMEAASGHKAQHTAQETAEEAEERLCVICLVNDRDTTVLPCRHMCMCHECAQELRKQTSKCPICRNHVESLLHIKMHKNPSKITQEAAAEAVAQKIEELKI
ncbi:hypothetical protein WJX73_002760 [Symbiochloris irregularis]|uniref:RING-type E3 ubiquitin transferase n=1 Tax=Symbiochloris irregularis TaxID=706552 RepID=A0AAW1NP24_9CHLO